MPLFCDIETTGLSPEKGAVPLSIAMIVDQGTLESPVSTFVVDICPTPEQWEAASPQALELNGLTIDYLIEHGVSLPTATGKLCDWLACNKVDQLTLYVGQNPEFDLRFLRYFMGPQLGWMGFPLDMKPVDVISMAKDLVRRDKNFKTPNFKGASISLALGLETEAAIHTSIGGVQACRRNYYALVERLKIFYGV